MSTPIPAPRLLLIADYRTGAPASRDTPLRRYRIARLPAGARRIHRSTGSAHGKRVDD